MTKSNCHCGNVAIEFGELPAYLVSCNCSICHRLGSLCAYCSPDDVAVIWKNEPTATYVWGDRLIAFHHCPICGCATHYTTTAKSEGKRVGINCRMVDPQEIASVPIRRFDGAESWTFLDD